jgi:hypothetical protein
MGFDKYLVNDFQPEENHLEMGFEVDPVHDVPDQSCKFIVFQKILHC